MTTPRSSTRFDLARLRAGTPIDATGLLTRFRVPLLGDAPVARRTLARVPLELPRINYERHAGKPYRHVWGTSIQVEGDFLNSIVKIDTETGAVATWHAAGHYPGEPVFVPSPSRSSRRRRRSALGGARHGQGSLLPAGARRREPERVGPRRRASCRPLPFPRRLLSRAVPERLDLSRVGGRHSGRN